MSTPCRLALGALIVFAGACRTTRPAERPQPAPDVAAPTPAAPDAAAPADAAADDDVPENVRNQRAVLRRCPAPAGTPTIVPDPGSYLEAEGPWTPASRRTATDVPAPVTATCTAMEGRRRAALARLPANAPSTDDDAHVESVGRCFYAGRGAWVLEPGAARVRSEPDVTDEPRRLVEFAWTLAYVKPDGQVVRMRRPAGARGRGVWRVFHDFDGDGVAEAGLRLDGAGAAGGTTLYAVRDGAIAPYARGAGVDAELPFDVDADGRPDLLQESPFATANTCGPSVFTGVPEVAHALADGGFSRDDAVAREWMRQRCAGVTPAAAEHILDLQVGPGREIVGMVGCLRYVGVSAEAIQRALDAQWPADAEDHCWSRPDVARSLREARVPFQVPPCALDANGR